MGPQNVAALFAPLFLSALLIALPTQAIHASTLVGGADHSTQDHSGEDHSGETLDAIDISLSDFSSADLSASSLVDATAFTTGEPRRVRGQPHQ